MSFSHHHGSSLIVPLRLLVILISISMTTKTVDAASFSTTSSTAETSRSKEGVRAKDNDKEAAMSFQSQFDLWISMHEKQYSSNEEYLTRLNVFAKNAELVSQHNEAYERGWTSFAMSLDGPFSDLTEDEFDSQYLMEPQNCSATHVSSGSVGDLLQKNDVTKPKFVDWRTKGVVTPIKNQGGCGSCWTFSTTGSLEAHHCIAAAAAAGENAQEQKIDCTHWTGLAEQQLIDCAGDYNNNGCNGGLPSQAFEYIRYNGGIMKEDVYPYHAKANGFCKKPADGDIGARVDEVFNITSYNEREIVLATANIGPVSIAYQVASDFRLYKHGVYDSYDAKTNTTICSTDPQQVNHAVVVVGYGDTMQNLAGISSSVPFYIVRNSWGNTWGMEGYFWMKRGINLCGLSDCASFPLVTSHHAYKIQEQYFRTNTA